MEIALKLHSMEDDDYNNDAYNNDDYNNNNYNTTTINKIVEECECELHLLWDTFSSLATNHAFVVTNNLTNCYVPQSPHTFQTGWIYISLGGPLYIHG